LKAPEEHILNFQSSLSKRIKYFK